MLYSNPYYIKVVVIFIPNIITGDAAIIHKARFQPLVNAKVKPDTNKDKLKNN